MTSRVLDEKKAIPTGVCGSGGNGRNPSLESSQSSYAGFISQSLEDDDESSDADVEPSLPQPEGKVGANVPIARKVVYNALGRPLPPNSLPTIRSDKCYCMAISDKQWIGCFDAFPRHEMRIYDGGFYLCYTCGMSNHQLKAREMPQITVPPTPTSQISTPIPMSQASTPLSAATPTSQVSTPSSSSPIATPSSMSQSVFGSTKKCQGRGVNKGCGRTLPASSFSGRNAICKTCIATASREKYPHAVRAKNSGVEQVQSIELTSFFNVIKQSGFLRETGNRNDSVIVGTRGAHQEEKGLYYRFEGWWQFTYANTNYPDSQAFGEGMEHPNLLGRREGHGQWFGWILTK